jgi:transcriptional regulator with XRE-family HTH domain
VRRRRTLFFLVERRITSARAESPLAPAAAAPDAAAQLAEVGRTIRALRRERGLSLRDVGRLTGFSISFLSMVERGRSSLTLTSLHTLAVVLGVDTSVFFPAPDEQPEPPLTAHVNRSTADSRLQIGGDHIYRLLGATGFERALEPLLVTIAPGESSNARDDYAHDGEEFAYVLSGELAFAVNGVEHRLEAGDSIHFQSTIPHLVRNDGDDDAEVLWVLTPRLF